MLSSFVIFLVHSSIASAAPCCASASSVPSMITGDEAAQAALTMSESAVVADAPDQGLPVFRSKADEVTRLYRLSVAKIFADCWQLGVSAPIIQHFKTNTTASATGIGDISFSSAYEFLPEWSYSEWKPRGYIFAQLLVPSGLSTYESVDPSQVDVTGKGFYTSTVGFSFLKRWAHWDVLFVPEFHLNLSRSFQDTLGNELSFGTAWGTSAAFGVGVTPGTSDFRFGARIQPQYTSAKNVQTSFGTQTTSFQLVWDFNLDISYMISDEWGMNTTYTDQTFFGPAFNNSLSRTLALTLQKRWLR